METRSRSQSKLTSTPLVAWSLTTVVAGLAVYVWGSSFSWQFSGLTLYQVFPILGLLAFSIMWSHYMAGFMRATFLRDTDMGRYFDWTGYVVLVAIVLHPGILIYQRFRDGFGLPPSSYESYVAPGMAWITLLGTVSLLTFLAFELHRRFKHRSWWKYVVSAGDVAMLAIFYHGLELGTQTHIGWYRVIWWFYGVTLLARLAYTYGQRLHRLATATR